jgi:GNAT superfamily N-acetyltransferase
MALTISAVSGSIDVRRLAPGDVDLIGEIDRSEHVDRLYSVEDHQLAGRPVDLDVPPWSREGTGEHSVGNLVDHFRPIAEAGATVLGAYDGNEFLGIALVDGRFEPGMAWLGLLHVSRPHRRRGVASALWAAAVEIGRRAGARSMYVSATPSGSAVGFYLERGCDLADPPHPDLLAEEPEDIHFVCSIG